MGDGLLNALQTIIDGGQLILGRELERFEERIAARHATGEITPERTGTAWAVGVSNGTDALALALEALGVGPGDEVVTVPNTFVATVAAIVRRGAVPVFVDVDEHQVLDPARLRVALTRRTKAIVPVHLNGRPADMTAIMAIADAAGVPVVEDAAQAIDASWAGRPVGTYGVLGCYSLHPLKNLGALGDGGVVVGHQPSHRDALRLLRNHGLRDRDTCERWGHNARLDALQAALLNVKLDRLTEWTARRRSIADTYLAELAGLSLQLPVPRAAERAVWSGFVVQTDDRDALRSVLAAAGVETLVYYPVPVHLQPAAARLGYSRGDFPVAERQARRMLSLPVHPHLSNRDVAQVVDAIRGYFHDRAHREEPEG
ncbi:DegT/DnrJ/EryC1/StrS family aminotransferase [Krasilnikovia sp. M28-CT-15]|uniref:DegT/DnrJ/EryC1/StrS family aminotransferase n=1 Tax=Krasilnikovia sp. M28-CT-15 TaxID=3373540 RepID=UPI00399CA527